MTPELTALTLAALLQFGQFIAYAIPANRELGPGYTMSARDTDPSKQMSTKTARLGRAFENHFEGLILFAIAVGVIQMSGQNTWWTGTLAYTYLIARIAYVPAYVMGLRPHRSLIWVTGFAATGLMLLAALV